MTGDPAYIGSAPVDILVFQIENPFGGYVCSHHIAACGVYHPFGFAGSAACVEDIKHILRVHLLRLTIPRRFLHEPMPP